MAGIPGILILNDNKTYGKSGKRFLYKCIPHNKDLSKLLIPYDIKVGFSKFTRNKFILFSIVDTTSTHIRGQLRNVIGDVDCLVAFYEYQLICKNLHFSLNNFNRQTLKIFQSMKQEEWINTILNNYPIEDRREKTSILTIDPEGCKDFDDAFDITNHNPTSSPATNDFRLSIYIANVPLWIDALKLWPHISKRVSSIYLPNETRNMLPNILSNTVCSLCEKADRFAFSLDIDIKDSKINDISFKNTLIRVGTNYVYEEFDLIKDSIYQNARMQIQKLSHIIPAIPVKDSHSFVEFLMVLMNNVCAEHLYSQNTGIFRMTVPTSSKSNLNPVPASSSLPDNLKTWGLLSGEYTHHKDNITHQPLSLKYYTHITSPIRRIVDILNIMNIQQIHKLIKPTEESLLFFDSWNKNIERINKDTKSIRKIQNDCELLNIVTTQETVLSTIYEGYIVDIMSLDYTNKYNIYVKNLKIVSSLKTRENMGLYEKVHVKLFIFKNENTLKQKVRLQLAKGIL